MIKSIFARPVFINPQAYLVIPQLANLSMLEPIDFTSTNTYSFESLGKVESKIISAKDEYILHIDLYESYGSCVLGEFYIGPATIGSIDDFTITTNGYVTTIEVGGGDSGNIVYPGLIAAWSAKGKTNDDEDRDILRDLTGNGHDITLNGFAFTPESGYNNPQYPDALVFDGVDDYGSAVDFGGKEVKTVISKYQTLKEQTDKFSMYFRDPVDNNIYKRIKTNKVQLSPSIKAFSNTAVILDDYCIIQQSLGNPTTKPFQITGHNGSFEVESIAFYSAYLFDRSLDEQEIKEFIRKYIDPEYLLPSEILTPDCYYDFSLGSNDDENRETIKDQSGNGNDAKAHNIAWAGMSGYGGYNLPIEKYILNGTFSGPIRQYGYDFKDGESIGKLRFNVSNLSEGTYFSIRIVGLDYSYKINKNGYWELKDITNNTGNTKTWEIVATNYTYNNVTIEFLPEYEGALVLDGVDDYIALEAFNSGFKTIFMVCNPFIRDIILYDQRKDGVNHKFAIYNGEGAVLAYQQRNDGETYINGILNTTIITNKLYNKKHLITIKNNSLNNSQKPIIGSNQSHTQFFANMAIYKFLGFKDELTEEQIQAIIKKYNLLDGMDEIEVS